jgi:aconitate hydratase
MGILPLQFLGDDSAESLGLTGEETYSIIGLAEALDHPTAAGRQLTVVAQPPAGAEIRFSVGVRIDTPQEIRYYQNGGILPYVLRQLLEADVHPGPPEGTM